MREKGIMKRVLSCVMMVILVCSVVACGGAKKEKKELNLFVYPEMIPDSLIDKFESDTGIQVNISFIDNDTMVYTKLSEDSSAFDLSMPTISTIHAMEQDDMLAEIDYDSLENKDNITTENCEPCLTKDDLKYATPFISCGYYWIYNPETCPVEVTSYNDLVDEKLKGQISTLPYSFMFYPISLKSLGYSELSKDKDEVNEASKWVEKFVKNVKVYDPAAPCSSLKNGECSIAFSFSSDVANTLKDYPNMKIAQMPGAPYYLMTQYWVIGKKSPNAENALKFIDYIYNLQNYAECMNAYPQVPTVKGVEEYLDKDIRTIMDTLAPTEDQLQNLINPDSSVDAISVWDEKWNSMMTQ